MKKLQQIAISTLLALLISACGGGGDDTTFGSSSAVRSDETVLGRVTGFGSVFVDGVEYETDNTQITVNGVPADESALKLGMVVLLRGNSDGSHGEAFNIDVSDEIHGFVDENLTGSGGALQVMGQTVYSDPLTVFESAVAGITTIAAIPQGAIVEISGYRDADGALFATRIELKKLALDPGDEVSVKGRIEALDENAKRLTLGTMGVDYSQAEIKDVLIVGRFYEISSRQGRSPISGDLIADEIEAAEDAADQINTDEGEQIKLEGRIDKLLTANLFTLNGLEILVNQETEFEDGDREQLAENALIKVRGHLNEQGQVSADEIEFHSEIYTEIEGIVSRVDSSNNTLTIGNSLIHYSSETLVKDEWKEDRSFNLQQIRVGDELEIDTTQDASGNLFAVKLIRKSGTDIATDDEDHAEGSEDEDASEDETDEEGSPENEDDGGNTGVPGTTDSHRVLAFNDLGMHCADLDYTTFVVLPPFNVIRSQVIERGAIPRILSSAEVDVAYKAQMDAAGSINTTSQNLPGSVQKTNFWDINPASGNTYVFDLFGGNPPADVGLLGQSMPGVNAPYSANEDQPFGHYDADFAWFSADGVPILPVDDAGQTNAYPLMQVTARDKTSGQPLASLDIVLPVASEADCQNCHALGEIGADSNRRPDVDFIFPDDINDPNDVLQAAKANILRLHDNKHGTDIDNQRPVLCAGCHYSAALDLAGNGGPVGKQVGHAMMSQVMHGHHGELRDPATDELVFPENGTLEETCYQCHPGKVTKCLRGAMGGAGITCQNCHGGMLAVGGVHDLPAGGSLDGTNDGTTPRQPWIDEPRCESCHTGDSNDHLGDTIRLNQTWESGDPSATPRRADNKRFAENPAKLYRNSLGHGGVACEGCHGSTHAIWPNAVPGSNDNVAAEQLQGHAGTLTECSSCHTSLGLTLEGPHGMHNVNSPAWTEGHESFYKQNPGSCRACHGQNLEGTALSRTAANRDLQTEDNGPIHLAKGTEVSCTLCHKRP